MKKKILLCVGIPLLIIAVVFIFRIPIMKGMAAFLICSSPPGNANYIFVLSGAPVERAGKAAEIWQMNPEKRIICTGSNQPQDFVSMDMAVTESEITALALRLFHIPDTCVSLLSEGTSTMEEAQAILKYCVAHKIHEAEIVSSAFHTRRVSNVFKQMFLDHDIVIRVIAAPSISYKEMEWWNSEYGLIALNNEYVKLVYYFFK